MNDQTPHYRPRVSRETRQLLATVLLAVIALWVLGRVRYPDRAATTNPVPALLTQLAPRPALDDLAAESAQLRNRLGASLLVVRAGEARVAGFRMRDDTALALMPRSEDGRDGQLTAAGSRPPEAAPSAASGVSRTPAAARGLEQEPVATSGAQEGSASAAAPAAPATIAADPATGLTLLRVAPVAAALAPEPWTPQQLDLPRYLMATIASSDAVSLRPAFVPSLEPVTSPAWSDPIWAVAPDAGLRAGSLLFTADAQLAGAVVAHGGGVAIVPAVTLLADAHRLRQMPPRTAGAIGVDVQELTAGLAAATGARHGVVVTWVDPAGPAAGHLETGDVIEAADGRWLQTREHWDVRAARMAAGEPLVLGVRRQGEWHDVQLVAAAPRTAPLPFGLTLRRAGTQGSEVVAVDRGSAGAAAGLQRGDVITLVGETAGPTPAQVRAAFDASDRRPVLVAFSRGSTSRVATLHR